MPYSYGIKNVYRPSKLAPNAYAWSTRPGYTSADVPSGLMDQPANITHDQYVQQFAYEWFQSGSLSDAAAVSPNGVTWSGISGYTARSLTNPPFISGAAGRLLPMLRDAATGGPARILRGYIRRAGFESGDAMSRARLYFMYNPEIITRDYVSYLNQTALDPFNSVYGSANDVAPPSFMDFTFAIFFDRQEEAADPVHPGVFVDYQYFDMVVRNVIPSDPNSTSNTLPDNGVMMVNPRDITVIFSPQITVQGRPLNANVRFEKFTHRMVPTRMTITMTVRVVYIGPVRDMVEYHAEELKVEDAIPMYDKKGDPYNGPASGDENNTTNSNFDLDPTNLPAATKTYLEKTYGIATDGSDLVRKAALDWARAHVTGSTKYDSDANDRANLPISADCSGLVGLAFRGAGVGPEIGWGSGTAWVPDTATMHSMAANPNNKHFILKPLTQDQQFNWRKDLRPGDILWRDGHVALFVTYSYPGGIGPPVYTGLPGGMRVFSADGHTANPQVGERPVSVHGNYTHMIRVVNVGSSSSIAASSSWDNNMTKTKVPI